MKNNYLFPSLFKVTLLNLFVISIGFNSLAQSKLNHQSDVATNSEQKPTPIDNDVEYLWEGDGPFASFSHEDEMLERRNVSSKTFKNSDGSFTLATGVGSVHYKENPNDDFWNTIDTRISNNTSGYHSNYNYSSTKNSWKSFYSPENGFLIQFFEGALKGSLNKKMGWYDFNSSSFVGPISSEQTPSSSNFDESTLLMNNVFPGCDYIYRQGTDAVEMDLIINSASSIAQPSPIATHFAYSETFEIPNGWTVQLEDAISNNITNQEGVQLIKISDNNGNLISQYETPYFYEKNAASSTYAADLEDDSKKSKNPMIFGSYDVKQIGNLVTFYVLIDRDWILDSSRNFPIVIDPTLGAYPSLTNYHCAWAYGRTSSRSNGSTSVHYDWDGSCTSDDYFYARYNTSSLPLNISTVTSSYLRLYKYSGSYNLTSSYLRHLNNLASSATTTSGNMSTVYDNLCYSTNNVSNSFTVSSTSGYKYLYLNSTGYSNIVSYASNGWLAYGMYSPINGDIWFYGWNNSTYKPYMYINYTTATLLDGDNCTNAQDLNTLTSPYSSTTSGYISDWLVCGTNYSGGPDRVFYIDVADGATLQIGQTTNLYDSKHYIGYGATSGATCPWGDVQIACIDDPDTQTTTWTNTTGVTKRVYYLLDAYTTGSGSFTLSWTYTLPPTWVGNGDVTNWNDGANWNTGSAPGVSDNVIFPAVIQGMPPNLGGLGGACNDLTIESGSDFILAGATVTVNGALTSSGNVQINSGKLDVVGAATFSNGAVIGSGEIEVDGASTIGNGSTLQIGSGTYDANGSFTALGATIDFTTSGALTLATTPTSLGYVDISAGTVKFDGASQTIPVDTYYNLTLSGSGTKTLAGSTCYVNGNLTVDAGTFAMSSYNLNVTGTTDINSTITISTGTMDCNGNFDATGGTIDFSSTGIIKLGGSTVTSLGTLDVSTGSIWYDRSSGTQNIVSDTYNNLRIYNATKTAAGNLTVNGAFVVGSGTANIGSYTTTVTGVSNIDGTLKIGSGAYNSNGAFDATGGTIDFTGNGKLKLSSTVTSLGTLDNAQGTVEYDAAGGNLESPIIITEAELGNTDWFEIQNISNASVDVTGWRVVVSNNYQTFSTANSTEKVLSGNMAAGALQYWSDNSSDNYWGSNLFWHGASTSTGWIAILDNSNVLRDFVCWNWASASITSISTSVGAIAIGSKWTGNGFSATSIIEPYSLTGTDQNSLSGWSQIPGSKNATNSGLTTGIADGISISADTYYNLEIDGTVSTAGAVDVNGDLTVNASKSLDMSTYALNVAGDLTNNGTLTLSGNTTTLDGSSSQTIDGNNLTLNNLTINSAGVILSAAATVNGTLTLTSGDISSETDISNNGSQNFAATNVLALGSSASLSGGGNSSHVIGAMRRSSAGTSELTFPVGNGTDYRPCYLTPSASTATTYTVEYANSAHSSITYNGSGDNTTNCNTGVHHVAGACWWDIEKSSNGASAYIAINWDNASGVDTPGDMVLTHWNSGTSKWDKITASTTGSNGTGSATASAGRIKSSSAQSDFSPFNLGSGSANNTLPIDLLSFNTTCSHNIVDVDFSVVSQVNNDYFLIERSVDAMNWEIIGQINGVEGGNSNTQMDYTFVDNNPLSNLSYYRLTQVDFDGSSKTFYPVSTTCGGSEGGLPIDVYPNPASNEVTVELELDNYQGDDVYYTITDATGKAVLSDYIQLDRGFNKHTLDIGKLPNGVYILRFNQTKDHITETRIVKR